MSSALTVRLVGASLGAAMALAVLGLLFALAEIPLLESILHVRFVLGADGFLGASGPLAVRLGWLAVAVAAAAVGGFLAPFAIERRRRAGAWMGLGTYVGTLLAASLVPDLARAIEGRSSFPVSLLEGLAVAPFLMLLAGAVLVPLLACCLGAGEVWARVLRFLSPATLTSEPSVTDASRPWDRVLIAIIIGAVICWLVFGLAIGSMIGPDGLLGPDGFVD